MRNELEHNKTYVYTLGGLLLVIVLYLLITMMSLITSEVPKGLPEDTGGLTETVSIEKASL